MEQVHQVYSVKIKNKFNVQFSKSLTSFEVLLIIVYKCKKNCCFILMCKAQSEVTHIKQQKYFRHLKGRGYNKKSVLYPGPLR